MKKLTKKQIQAELRKFDSTAVFRIAKLAGVNIESRVDVMRFVEKYAPTQKVYRAAFRLTLCADHANQLKTVHNGIEQPIMNAANFMREQVANGSIHANYGKILIEGSTSIYWAHPYYGRSDYNKHRAFKNDEKGRKAMNLINSILNRTKKQAA